jgi:beta-galactosidase
MTTIRLIVLATLLAMPFPAQGNGGTDDPSPDVPVVSPRPVRVAGVEHPVLSLNGPWRFNPHAPAGFEMLRPDESARWAEIPVPSEWAMQGFSVVPGSRAGYTREFAVPADWIGSAIKLRFDGVQSECTVWVNGIEAGKHEGGFTVFEFDVTGAIRAGMNTVAVAVCNESLADTLASATQYAAHSIGGITRKVTLFALPPVHVAGQFITTKLRPGGVDADLEVSLTLVNESDRDVSGAAIHLELIDPAGMKVSLGSAGGVLDTLHAWESVKRRMVSPVAHPLMWDPEHPYLYTVRTTVRRGADTAVTIAQRVGFREVEVRGNRLFVNNVPVKLRGVNRHETHPLLGRSTSADQWRRDVELFRAANVNYIRTSHYPPTEEFLDACDELGVFVECESALCWVQHGANPAWQHWNAMDARYFSFLLRANLENVVANRAHPSIIIWSLANESGWSPLFAGVLERVKQLDPSRPTSFHDQCWGEYNNAGSVADIAVYHYPDEEGPAKCDSSVRPVLFGEYAHLQTYNRREVLADPGVRDDWGRGFERMVDLMWKHDGCLGGAIWAGIDDIFYLPDGKATGYGPWGIIDGWRRPKPEYWHVKKSYSPVKLVDRKAPLLWVDGAVRIPVANRFDFTNLGDVGIRWSTGSEQGELRVDIAPHQTGELVIPLKRRPRTGETLEVRFTDPRGFECEHEMLALAPRPASASTPSRRGTSRSEAAGQVVTLISGKLRCDVDRSSGMIRRVSVGNRTVVNGGPSLMILPLSSDECKPDYRTDVVPLNSTCAEPAVREVKAVTGRDGKTRLEIGVKYREADGTMALSSNDGRSLTIEYTFTLLQDINPRQWGVVVSVPAGFDRLVWTREGQWTTYPDDHIGRLTGEAVADPAPRPSVADLRHRPSHPWSLDAMEMGSNDFRSTKRDVINASLRSRTGDGVAIVSDSLRSIRAFVDSAGTGLLIAGYSTGGGEGFFAPHYARERKPLKTGDTIRDRMVLRFDVAAEDGSEKEK